MVALTPPHRGDILTDCVDWVTTTFAYIVNSAAAAGAAAADVSSISRDQLDVRHPYLMWTVHTQAQAVRMHSECHSKPITNRHRRHAVHAAQCTVSCCKPTIHMRCGDVTA